MQGGAKILRVLRAKVRVSTLRQFVLKLRLAEQILHSILITAEYVPQLRCEMFRHVRFLHGNTRLRSRPIPDLRQGRRVQRPGAPWRHLVTHLFDIGIR